MVLETPVNGQANALVTLNTRDFPASKTAWNEDLASKGCLKSCEGAIDAEQQRRIAGCNITSQDAERIADAEYVALNQLINMVLAEKLSALRTAAYCAERSARGDRARAIAILKPASQGSAPGRGR